MPTQTLSAYEQIGAAVPSIHRGQFSMVISGEGATRTLLNSESGALCMFDRPAGIVYTLPAPVAGMRFTFAVGSTITSNAAKVVTNVTASVFLLGSVEMISVSATTYPVVAVANGTNIAAISANGTTTGGQIGECYTVTAISSTQWHISGISVGTSVTTPFAAS